MASPSFSRAAAMGSKKCSKAAFERTTSKLSSAKGSFAASAGEMKSSLPAVRLAAQFSRRGIAAQCPGLQLQVKARVDRFSTRNAQFGFRLTCDLDCTYRARLEKVATGGTTLAVRGRAVGGQPAQVVFPVRLIAPGRYRFTVSLVAPVNPGPAVVLRSAPFKLS